MRASITTALLVLITASAWPQAASAQGWAPIAMGVRAGYDNKQRNEVVGAQLRIPVLPSGVVELMPNADVTFLTGLKEYQVNFEAVYLPGGRSGGLYGGGGIGFRDSIFGGDPANPRETVQTFSVVAGAKFGGLSRLNPQLEFRWVFLDEAAVDPQQITFGVSFALWNPGRPGG